MYIYIYIYIYTHTGKRNVRTKVRVVGGGKPFAQASNAGANPKP